METDTLDETTTEMITRPAPPPPGALVITTGAQITREALAATPAPAADLVAMLLADKRSPATKRAYAADLRDFFGPEATPADARDFLSLPAPAVAQRLAAYKGAMLSRGLSEATVNRRLAAVRSLLQFGYRTGHAATDGRGLVDGEKVKSYRDTRGVPARDLARLLALPADLHGDTLRGLRDAALLLLLCEGALRRAEVCALDVGDFDPQARRLLIRGKGRGTQKEGVTVSPECAGALCAYLMRAGHGTQSAGHGGGAALPLFRNLDRRRAHADLQADGGRLTPDGLHDLVGRYGRALGLSRPLSPHRIRHSAITAALDVFRGDVRKVQRLSRHAKMETLMRYDDARRDDQGEVTCGLSKHLKALGARAGRKAGDARRVEGQ